MLYLKFETASEPPRIGDAIPSSMADHLSGGPKFEVLAESGNSQRHVAVTNWEEHDLRVHCATSSEGFILTIIVYMITNGRDTVKSVDSLPPTETNRHPSASVAQQPALLTLRARLTLDATPVQEVAG